MKKFFKDTFLSFILIILILFTTPSAFAAHKVKGEPFKFISFAESSNLKVNKNCIYIEKIESTIINKQGYALIKGESDCYMLYGELRYKRKPLPVKTKMKTYIISNPLEGDNEILDVFVARYDYARVKIKVKIKKGKNKGKYKKVWRWKLLYCNGYMVN